MALRRPELRSRRERLEQLEHDADTLLEHYAGMVPEALEALTSEERHRVYKMLRLKVIVRRCARGGLGSVCRTPGGVCLEVCEN
jgi:hypothetical protein